jgi:hypothetical protein
MRAKEEVETKIMLLFITPLEIMVRKMEDHLINRVVDILIDRRKLIC